MVPRRPRDLDSWEVKSTMSREGLRMFPLWAKSKNGIGQEMVNLLESTEACSPCIDIGGDVLVETVEMVFLADSVVACM